jgi:hypothetical protein
MRFCKNHTTGLLALLLLVFMAAAGGCVKSPRDSVIPGSGTDTTAPTVTSAFPVAGASGVPLNSAVTVHFSEAMKVSTISSSNFSVTEPGLVAVTGTVTYNATSRIATFTASPPLPVSTLFTATILVGVQDLAGNALAVPYSWTFTSTSVGGAPTVSSVSPAGNATDASVSQPITVVFSEAMAVATLNSSSFFVVEGVATPVAGAVTCVGTTATFTPSANLGFGKTFTATVTTEATSFTAHALATPYVWSFSTGAAPDTTLPTVTSTSPAGNSTDAPANGAVTAVFSEPMAGATITGTSFTVMEGLSTPVAGVVTSVGSTATFTPSASLAYSSTFNALITTAVKDLAGNALAVQYAWSFSTGTAPDVIGPTVSSVNPADLDTNVAANQAVSAVFSEPMGAASLNSTSFTLTQGAATPVAGSVVCIGSTATFTPSANLAYNSTFTARITTAAQDLAGNALSGLYMWSFSTGTAPDTTPPTVSSVVPAASATNVPVNQALSAVFSEAMLASTVTNVSFTLTAGAATPVAGSVVYVNLTATFTPAANLAFSTTFTGKLAVTLKDLAGNALAAQYTWTFSTGTAPDTTPPTVSSVNPLANATNVPVNQAISAVFSEPMLVSTVTTVSMTLTAGAATPVAGSVTCVGSTATFTPSANLAFSTTFTGKLTVAVKDLAGNALAAQYTWTFSTGTAPDTTPPTVTSVNPANLATSVPVNQIVTAVFSELMASATITGVSFTLTQGAATPVAGSVSCPGSTLTFTPTANLAPGQTFNAKITTAVTDLAGNALAANYLWSFQTGAVPALGPAPVVLGTAINFVILAKSTVTTTGTTAVTGNIGLSPAAGTFLTGFSITMDSTNVFSTSSVVTGQLFAANYAVPTPSNLTTAVSDMETAYTDAAGRPTPDFVNLGAGNITGMTLVPGLYKWGTGLNFTSGVTLNGGANDVWIFQIAQDLTVANGGIVTLTGGAQPKNIFWQVAGQTLLGTTTDFKGIILCQTQIVMQTGSVVHGRALAQTAVTMNATAITAP